MLRHFLFWTSWFAMLGICLYSWQLTLMGPHPVWLVGWVEKALPIVRWGSSAIFFVLVLGLALFGGDDKKTAKPSNN